MNKEVAQVIVQNNIFVSLKLLSLNNTYKYKIKIFY